MSFPIITADQRLAEKRGIKGCILGASGIGKTSLLWSLEAERTLFFDLEAGDLAVEGWPGDTIRPRTWPECRHVAVYIGGPNPALRADQPYSQAHYDSVCSQFGEPHGGEPHSGEPQRGGPHSGEPHSLDKYETIFIDSITIASRLCLQWCKGQPQAFSERTGKPDPRATYGLHGQEMMAWLTHLQHTRHKNVWFIGILDEKVDDLNRKVYSPQIDGSKTALELPGIVDQVITLAHIKREDGGSERAFITHTLNPFAYPAKDRSGRLDLMEEPHLGKLMAKIRGPLKPACERLNFTTSQHEQGVKS